MIAPQYITVFALTLVIISCTVTTEKEKQVKKPINNKHLIKKKISPMQRDLEIQNTIDSLIFLYQDPDDSLMNISIILSGNKLKYLDYKLKVVHSSGLMKELSGKVYFNKRHGSRIKLRFHTYSNGHLLSHNEGNINTTITINEENRHVTFSQIIFKSEDRIDSTQSIFATPLIKPGFTQPYQSYMEDLLDVISATRNNYHSLLSQVSQVLTELESKRNKYDISSDTTMLKRILYIEIDSLTKIFSSHNIELFRLEDANTIKIIDKEFDKIMHFRIQYDKHGNRVSDGLESVSYNMQVPNYYEPTFGWLPFTASNDSFKKFGDITIGIMRCEIGYETISYLLTIWEEKDNKLELHEILQPMLQVDIGQIEVDTLLEVNSETKILICEKTGGEGGNNWGSLWIGKWSNPNQLSKLYEKHYDYIETFPFQYELSDGYDLTLKESVRSDSIVIIDKFNLLELME